MATPTPEFGAERLKSALHRGGYLRRIQDAYERLDLIGMGTTGMVWRGRNRSTDQLVAMKLVPKDFETSISEIECLSACTHPSVIGFMEVVLAEDKNHLYIIMELAVTDLRSVVQDKDQPMEENRVRTYMLQLLQGVAYLHNNGILNRDLKTPNGVAYLHNNGILNRDLKTPNLLLTAKYQLKICDYGFSRCCLLRENNHCRFNVYHPSNYSLEVGTLPYIAPEILSQALEAEEGTYIGLYSGAMDMWSIGCIMAELVCRKQLFREGEEVESGLEFDKDMDQLFNIMKLIPSQGQIQDFRLLRERIPSQFLSPQGFDLLTKLLVFRPEERISANEALDHPWFSEAELKT